jgi:hypothetical protein
MDPNQFIRQVGTKYYRICDDGSVRIVRIVANKNTQEVVVTGELLDDRFTIKLEDLQKKYKPLLPNGMITMFNATTNDKHRDVIIFASKTNTTGNAIELEPYVMCRQLILDIFAHITYSDTPCYGISVSKKSCPANVDFEKLMVSNADDVYNQQAVSIYYQDDLATILKLLKTTKSDEILKENYDRMVTNSDSKVAGVVSTTRELIETNGFFFDVLSMFNILPLPGVTIHYQDNSYVLYDTDLYRIEYAIKSRVSNVKIIEYSHYISEDELPETYSHIKFCDSTSKIYIMQYVPEQGFNPDLYPEDVRDGMVPLLNKYKN